jgi:glycine/D-amino acid oxidase-like deaminating enzyme
VSEPSGERARPAQSAPPAVADAVVVGGGPAGLSAALWLARHRRSVVVVDAGEHRNRHVRLSHGWLGADPQDPMALLEQARRDLARYETATLLGGRVRSARREPSSRFTLATDDGDIVALRVVLATGVVDALPEVDGFLDPTGRAPSTAPPATATRPGGARWWCSDGASTWPASPSACSTGPPASRW